MVFNKMALKKTRILFGGIMSIWRRSAALEEWWVKTYPNETYGVQILQAFHAGAEYEEAFMSSKDKEKIKDLQRQVRVLQELFSKAQDKVTKYENFFKFIKEQVIEEDKNE